MHHGTTSSEGWADLDSLLIGLYVTIDDLLGRPARLPGRKPKLTDSELACLAVAQVMLACPSEHRWLRFAMVRLGHLFPYLPQQPGYNKRLRALFPLLNRVLRHLAYQTPSWCDPLRLLDATPLPCARSRETVERSALRGYANYGYCASHSRYFWGFKLYLLTTPDGLVVDWCLADPKLKGQLSLQEHGGRTPAGVMARIAQRLLALGAGVWWNWQIGAAHEKRSLVAYDH